MIYITFIIFFSALLIVVSTHNKFVRKQNDIIMMDNREYNENTPYKKFLPKVTPNVIWVYIVGLFVIFIMGRIILCGKSETEFKNQKIELSGNGVLQIDSESYFIYIKNELVELPKGYTEIIIDESIDTPYIQDYYSRQIKYAIPNWKLFLLYNRKVDRVTDWKIGNCGCGGKYTLILDKKYQLQNLDLK